MTGLRWRSPESPSSAVRGGMVPRRIHRSPDRSVHATSASPWRDEPPKWSLLTFGVGEPLFEKYGHAALCLDYATSTTEPVCFNYGVTDFDDVYGTRVWHFLRGEQRVLGSRPEAGGTAMMRFYESRGSRRLRAADDDAGPPIQARRRSSGKLLFDIEPAHIAITSTITFSTTARRGVRDLVDAATGGTAASEDRRARIRRRFARSRSRSGIAESSSRSSASVTDFVLGRRLEDTPTRWQAMFYPDILRHELGGRSSACQAAFC